MVEGHKKLKIVLFPWLAFGHIIPFLQFSKYLAQKGHYVSFVSTPRNIKWFPKIPPHLTPLINLVELPLPRVENLPKDAEAPVDIPFDRLPSLAKAFDSLLEPMEEFLRTTSLDWILYDLSFHWLPPIAVKLGIQQEIRTWLDQYDQASMVYVAFGTEATQSQEDITEVALGLELSKLPFFWALKERVGLGAPTLPDGFEE
ncbi:hypothetical protein Ancab_008503 [Ancistrocladus abbreviatus]